ncbi:MAG: DNA repair protein RadA [Clostridia bacterium]|nr:DNA repair protein RadA [Clostridia bacterium]
MKNKTVFVCSECGAESPKWSGKCPECGAWNTLVEETVVQKPEKTAKKISSSDFSAPLKLKEVTGKEEVRISTGINELDRVLGGGIVKGALYLVSGEPGIGKSTILLQLCEKLGAEIPILYVSGEESPKQLRLRADRLGVKKDDLYLLAQTDIETVCEQAAEQNPGLLIIDSIQTMNHESVASTPGSVSQVRECTSALMRFAKSKDIPVFIVGHVNKEGSIAGPKVMEHMVDAVLYFEGERNSEYRILRAVKNRFGSTNEIGVFEMTGEGLKEIGNPSAVFLQGKPSDISGIATVCVLEGTRPIIAEVQSLVAPTPFPAPRRVAVGFDYGRANLLIAVLEKRCRMFFGTSDVYINVIGGLKIDEPAADLAVAAALASGLKDFVIPDDTILIGEVGLAGEIRAVTSLEKRVAEAKVLGFKRAVIPKRNRTDFHTDIELIPVDSIKDVFNLI